MTSFEGTGANQISKLGRTRGGSRVISEGIRTPEILEYVGDAVISVDLHGDVVYMNKMAEELTGFNRAEAIGHPLNKVFRVLDATTRKARENLAEKAMATEAFVPLENNAILITRDRRELAIEDSAAPTHATGDTVNGAVIVFHDSRYSSETTAKMSDLAQQDYLTGLLNRYAFEERFKQSMTLARRHKREIGLLFIDVDNFKEINDAWGHDCGDEVLKAIAQKLLSCIRKADSAARYGGDEFMVLLSEIEHPDHVLVVAEKVRNMTRNLTLPDGREVGLDISIGVSIFPDNGDTLEKLLRHADSDMYRNKALARKGNGLPKLI